MDNSGGSPSGSGSTTIQTTGVDINEQSFIWEIKNFPVVAKHDPMIRSQRMSFNAVDGAGQTSTWALYLIPGVKDGKRWIGIYYTLFQPPATPGDYLYSQLALAIKSPQGKVTWNADGGIMDANTLTLGRGQGFPQMLDAGSDRESLDIHVTFKLYSPAPQTCRVEAALGPSAMEQQLEMAMILAGLKDFKRMLDDPSAFSGASVTIRSRDAKEFHMRRDILAARSPVFEAMFRTHMTEATRGIIELPDMAGKSLEVFLHFIEKGWVLLPDWKEAGVLLELTNAAAKYQLLELLNYLDFMLGKVCTLENVAGLLALANQLGLKIAEEELLKFVREEGASSAQNFLKIVDVAGGGVGSPFQQ